MKNASWVAGFLEGEGTFLQSWWINKSTNVKSPTFSIQASSCDRDMLERLVEFSGYGKIYGPYETGNPKEKPYWKWNLDKRAMVEEFLLELRPHLLSRRGQKVDDMLDVMRSHPPLRNMSGHGSGGYKNGCRCNTCAAYGTVRSAIKREKRKEMEYVK